DRVPAGGQECLERPPLPEVEAYLQEGMAEVPELALPGREEPARHGLALHHVRLELLEGSAVQAAMGVGVVPELEAGVEPPLEDGPARGDVVGALARDEELALVHEAHDGNVVLAKVLEELASVLAEGGDGVRD